MGKESCNRSFYCIFLLSQIQTSNPKPTKALFNDGMNAWMRDEGALMHHGNEEIVWVIKVNKSWIHGTVHVILKNVLKEEWKTQNKTTSSFFLSTISFDSFVLRLLTIDQECFLFLKFTYCVTSIEFQLKRNCRRIIIKHKSCRCLLSLTLTLAS
ncbi:CLUMA_CG017073, isoform A [Clunio marinus]|uniref:CLUMA_CG017073, isoform A n=1 Tax=Clunio marinus TaxID=568069 RepID=A0A1J1IV17_9DIPT|nr:CLUMA_CG017073, isoform A [Clunio marinus]